MSLDDGLVPDLVGEPESRRLEVTGVMNNHAAAGFGEGCP